MRIVIVEDEIRIREGIRKLIYKMFEDYEIVGEAENGEEGFTLIMQTKPDLVITDIKMPIMDGLEMLTQIYQRGCATKAIVLSAYSEFAYAQQAIKLGVSEYLLKPIVVGDFVQSIKTIEKQWTEEKNKNPQILGSMENILFGIIYGGLQPSEELYQFIHHKYGFKSNSMFSEVNIYLGKLYDEKQKKVKRELKALFDDKKELQYAIVEIPAEKTIVVILYGYRDAHEIERWFQNCLLQGKNVKFRENSISYGWININGVEHLKAESHMLAKYMEWNISLGEAIMISYPKILQVQTLPCTYPIEIENKMKIAMCAYDLNEVAVCIQKFENFFTNGQVYAPKEIKESYVRFLWSLINIAKEIGALDYKNFEQQKIIEMIMNAINHEELRSVCGNVYKSITSRENKECESATLTVKRAESMIREFYNTGITLDEIALKLNITPEYLGSQFRKEIGVNFSAYIKEIRVKKAKELLIGSQMKLYEIAEKVGYADAKYFSRVFKETTGQLPADYRRTNK